MKKKIPLEVITTETECEANERIARAGSIVFCPAGSSDPAACRVVAVLPTSWPTIPPSKQEVKLLVEMSFPSGEKTFSLEKPSNCIVAEI